MRNLLNPKWLFIINTLPIAVLFVLFYGQFNIIKTLLDEDTVFLWKTFGLKLGVLGLLNLAYAGYSTFKKQNVSVFYGVLALLSYIAFMYLYTWRLGDIFPFSVPQWMLSGQIYLYVFTFLMPTIAYSLFVLTAHFTPEIKEHKAWVSFLIAVSIPVAGYLLSFLEDFFWYRFNGAFYRHALMILILIASIVFLFFLVRSIFILATKKAAVWKEYQLAWKIPIAVVLPLLGLLVNNGFLFNKFVDYKLEFFGDFSNYWFYILAVLNGILICLPNLDNKIYRLFLFIGRSITFAYTFYFFLVFLPFLPLSVVAVIAAGTGFLMLTPLVLFVIHINEISKDFNYLRTWFSKKLTIGIAVLGFLVIPACITVTYLKDKHTLNQTLTYLYSPDYSKEYNINKKSLQKILHLVKQHKDRGFFMSDNQIPYLSSYFNWLVFNNLTLSDAKINYIEKVFFGKHSWRLRIDNIENENVEISKISTSCTYDTSQNAWKSWVDLEITNKNEKTRFAEYAATIDLPEGCWISDYYLYVNNVKEPGILAEKKAAMWIFSQIRTENRDPGILYYLTGNKVAFRIFPFAKNEVRKTGIEFLHKEPVTLRIDNHRIELGNPEETIYETVETEHVMYISAKEKQTLKEVKRKPYFHFLVDVSEGKEKYSADFVRRMEEVLRNNPSLSENAQISFVNSYVNTHLVENNLMWCYDVYSQNYDGGFYLERAVKMALFNAYKNKQYPVIVVVTDSIQKAVLSGDFSDFQFAFPESHLFFNLDSNGNLHAHSLINEPLVEISQVIIVPTYEDFMENMTSAMFHHTFDQSVLEYKLPDNSTAYLPNNSEPSIVLKNDIFEIPESEIREKDWQSALAMQGKWRSQILHPETSDDAWHNILKSSFISRIMTPATSYLVVENEAQKAMLKKKQEQALSSGKSLDLGETPQTMNEPSIWILATLFGLALIYRQIRGKTITVFGYCISSKR
ncbi:MAG: MSEP-CTERM sorting domain-containing protein [Lentimicrobiaceae bacterium]|nr:MSEP-CTERM sorting domain-containing protein [Lentimicrobiaceae bacterium]